ncbi:MAG: hypothetical protein WC783_01610 [Candidatus Paceibacterota bacterium]|jgi:hypothetical protein
MIEIKDLLIRFQNLFLSEEVKRETIRGVISQTINLPLKKEDVEIKNNIVYLNIKPVYKNEIFIKKEQIFSELKRLLGSKSPSDVR